jgi:hypothetical protein
MELGALAGDLDMFPYEVLESIARRLGFGPALRRALDGIDRLDGLEGPDGPEGLDGLDGQEELEARETP